MTKIATPKKVIWTPQPKQIEFMSRGEDEALYGGSAGGGKSDALVAEALRQVAIPHYKGIIFRRTYKQLEELIDKSHKIYKGAYPRAKYNASSHSWRFPSGAKILFRDLQHENDKLKYQGHEYQYIAFDELTHFTFTQYMYIKSRCRPSGPGVQCYIRGSANPGGVGHGWVKERFITPLAAGNTIWEEVEWFEPDGTRRTSWQSRTFIPSSVFDNPALMANDPTYIARLASLPESEKNALLYGDWDSFSGQVFREWTNDPKHYIDHEYTHVIEPFRVPSHWPIWCGLDWGYSKPFSVGWYAIDEQKRMYRIREYYGCESTPNTGIRTEPQSVARKILEIERDDPNLRNRPIFRIGDPAIWGSQTGESIGDMMAREHVQFDKGEHARIDGKMQCHYRLQFDDYNRPMFYCFNTCKHFIRTVPNLVYDEANVEDIDTDGEDHIYDEWRYVCMANPIEAKATKEIKPHVYDPLDINDDYYRNTASTDRYDIYRRVYS